MADADMAASWKDAEKMLDKGKTEGALQLLRKADPDGTEVTTLRLAGKAIFTLLQPVLWLEQPVRFVGTAATISFEMPFFISGTGSACKAIDIPAFFAQDLVGATTCEFFGRSILAGCSAP